MIPRILACLALILLSCLPALADPSDAPSGNETLLLQEPTISAEHVVFVHAQDLWVVARKGGLARRLTSDVGRESNPHLSPDGRWVAFSAEYEGNHDVYAIPTAGGAPRRLTWHPAGDSVRGWHPDGKRVLFSSGRLGGVPVERLYLVGLTGGTPTGLAIPRVGHATYDASGKRLAYTQYRDAFRSWKRYRGGRTPSIWIYDPEGHEVEVVPHVNASDTFPCWIGKDVYFASDRAGANGVEQMNIWRYTPGSKKPAEQITRFGDFGVRNMSASADALVFSVGGSIRVYTPRTKAFERLRIHVPTDGLGRLPRWNPVKGFVRNADLSPNGKRAVFEARGDIITVPREHGSARNLTQTPGVHERSPAWSPDGKHIAWFSDEGGEYGLMVRDRLGREPAKRYDLGGASFYNDPLWSPDGKCILFSDKGNRLAYVTLDSGAISQVSQTQGTLGQLRPTGVWSPDSKWIAFEHRNAQTTYDGIWLFEVESGKSVPLTDGFSTANNPAFTRDGKYLFFSASVNSGPGRFGLDLSTSAARRPDGNLYVAVLQKDGKNPLGARSDEGLPEAKDKKKKKGKRSNSDEEEDDEAGEASTEKKKKEEDADKDNGENGDDDKPSIDLAGLSQRILALPVPSGNYGNLTGAKDKLFFISYPRSGKPSLKSFDFKSRKAKEVMAGVSRVRPSADGKTFLVRTGGHWSLVDEKGKNGKTPKIDGVKVRVVPELEWPQILRECWRIQRDFFYDPNMHGVNWPKMWDRWSALLPHVQHRADLNILMSEMMGELCCGHEYVWGGDYESAKGGINVGLLGADFEIADGRFRIARIYEGQNWNPGLRAPLTEPGVGVLAGDFLISVNGRPVKATENLFSAFESTAGQSIDLEVSAQADGTESRTYQVVPVSNDNRLRRKAWIEANRKRVDELSGGKLAYIYMPNTAGAGLAAFNRDYYSQLDKQGLVLDERFNGGGKVADHVVHVLGHETICYWMNREGWLGRTPFGTLDGPKVMIVNERAGSGGDAMPWMFQKLGIGPVVGTRTWGGLVGISGYPPLVDGGGITAASFGIMDTEGNWVVENVGVTPDVEVIQWPKQVVPGGDPQLEKAVEIALELLAKNPPKPRPGYKPPETR